MSEVSSYIGWIGCGLLLTLYTVQDIKQKKINLRFALLLIPFLIAQIVFNADIAVLDRLGGVVLGTVFLGVSRITKEKIGIGDGWVILLLGAVLGGGQSIQIIFYSFLCLMAAAMILVIFFHVSKNKTVPFIPFLLCGFLFCCFFNQAGL